MFQVLLEGMDAFASRRRCFQLCLQGHLNFNLICFQKSGPVPPSWSFLPQSLSLLVAAPLQRSLCWQNKFEGKVGMQEWERNRGEGDTERGQAVGVAEWMSPWWGSHVQPGPGMDGTLGNCRPWNTLRASVHNIKLRVRLKYFSKVQTELHPWMLCPNVPQQFPCCCQARPPHKDLWHKQIKNIRKWRRPKSSNLPFQGLL